MLDKKRCPVILGMIQPEPFPGSYQNNGMRIDEIVEMAIKETEILHDCGFGGYIIQNRNDAPVKQQAAVQHVAYMTRLAHELRIKFPEMMQGILLNWDGVASLAVADAVGADFIRVEHTFTGIEVGYAGIMEAQCVDICDFKKKIASNVPVFADIQEIHYEQIGAKAIGEATRDLMQNAFADGVFIGGKTVEESLKYGRLVRERIGPNVPVLLSSGATGENIAKIMQVFDGVSVGTWIKNGNMRNPIDQERANALIHNANQALSIV